LLLSDAYGVDGLGRAVDEDSVFHVYCAGKPLMAATVGVLVDARELSFDDVLGDIVEGARGTPYTSRTILQLLTHTAGVLSPSAADLITLPPCSRGTAVLSQQPEPVTDAGAYSEAAGWMLLALAVEELAGVDFASAFRTLVAEPLGLDDCLFFGPTSGSQQTRERINVDVQEERVRPLIIETSMADSNLWLPATGARASAEGLCRFYSALADRNAQCPRPLLKSHTLRVLRESRTRKALDPAFGRVCSYSAGFMADLSDHHFGGQHSIASIGHSGLHGMTFAADDPSLGISYAVHLNGVTRHDSESNMDHSPQLRRRYISDSIIRAFSGSAR
jgi:CubicO group peptidase (beta-lactamase class C family)